jgi:hypothetical protein
MYICTASDVSTPIGNGRPSNFYSDLPFNTPYIPAPAARIDTRQLSIPLIYYMSQNASSITTNKLQLNLNLQEGYDPEELGVPAEHVVPSLWGVPLKYIS